MIGAQLAMVVAGKVIASPPPVQGPPIPFFVVPVEKLNHAGNPGDRLVVWYSDSRQDCGVLLLSPLRIVRIRSGFSTSPS